MAYWVIPFEILKLVHFAATNTDLETGDHIIGSYSGLLPNIGILAVIAVTIVVLALILSLIIRRA